MEVVDPASRIEAILNTESPRFRRSFLSAVRFLREERTLLEIEQLLLSGNLTEALSSVQAAAQQIATTWNGVFVNTGARTASFLSDKLPVLVNFDQVNVRAVDAMTRNDLRLVNGFTTRQVEATNQALVRGIQRGDNPRVQARAFRDSLGLTPNQEQHVANYRQQLRNRDSALFRRKLRDQRFDETVRRAITDKKNLTESQIDRMVERYRQGYIKHRSEVIARTESLRSVHQASHEMYDQAIDAGTIDPTTLERRWNTAGDERVRGSHASMHGQFRAVNEPFISGLGNALLFPGDPDAPAEDTTQCRCSVGTRFIA